MNDALVHAYEYTITNPINGQIICKLKIDEFHLNTNRAFSLEFVRSVIEVLYSL